MGIRDRLRLSAEEAKRKSKEAASAALDSASSARERGAAAVLHGKDRFQETHPEQARRLKESSSYLLAVSREAAQAAQEKGSEIALDAKGAVREGQLQGRDVLDRAHSKVRQLQPERVEQLENAAEQLVARSKDVSVQAASRRREMEARVGETRVGSATGRLVKRGASVAVQMPILSLVPDVVSEKNGTSELVGRVRSDPEDMYANLWLGESLRSQERDMRLYALARTAINPVWLLGREAFKTAANLGPTSPQSPSERYLLRAYSIAAKRLEHKASPGPDVADAYHVIARYYLAAGKPGGGIKAAKMAVVRAHGSLRGIALVTLARIYVAEGYVEAASVAAKAGISAGCSLGYEVLADLNFNGPHGAGARQRLRDFADQRSKVEPQDRIAYYGSYRTMSATARAVATSQWGKSKHQLANARTQLDKWHQRTTRGRGAAGEGSAGGQQDAVEPTCLGGGDAK